MKQKTKKAKNPVEQPQRKRLSEMLNYELGIELNNAHNTIHQADAQRMQAAQNINAIMAEIELRKNG